MSAPAGYELLRGAVPAGVTAIAKKLLAGELGTETTFALDGRHFLSRIEPHPPAPDRGLPAWHKGVTIYERIASSVVPGAVKIGALVLASWCAYRLLS